MMARMDVASVPRCKLLPQGSDLVDQFANDLRSHRPLATEVPGRVQGVQPGLREPRHTLHVGHVCSIHSSVNWEPAQPDLVAVTREAVNRAGATFQPQ